MTAGSHERPEQVGTNAELMNGRKMIGQENAPAPSTVLADRPANDGTKGVGSPTVLCILLGARLRRLREAQRISPEEAGYVIRASHSKISRWRAGPNGCR